MSTTITLSPELSERVTEIARQHGVTPETLIAESLAPPPIVDEAAALREALEAGRAGKLRDAAAFFAEHRRKYPDPDNGQG